MLPSHWSSHCTLSPIGGVSEVAVLQITNLVATFFRDLLLKKLGRLLYMPKLANTLERIRDEPDGFYNGELAKDIVQDIKEN